MNIQESIELLKEGKVLLYPSDTIWGIGCDATNDEACQHIHEIKNRPDNKSFIVLVDGFPMLERYIPEFNEVCYDIVDYSEKPITIIYPNAEGLAPSILAEDGSVGIRITKDPICLKLIRGMRKPLVSTSANLSGEPHPTEYGEISEGIKSGVDGILEEKQHEKMIKPSQIIKIGLNGEITIIRK